MSINYKHKQCIVPSEEPCREIYILLQICKFFFDYYKNYWLDSTQSYEAPDNFWAFATSQL